MKTKQLHRWDVPPSEAGQIQARLRDRLVLEAVTEPPQLVAGVDVAIRGGLARAAVVVLSWPDLALREVAVVERPVDFPYVPGLLAFREAPVILAACEQLDLEPELFFVDGHGLAHPRRFGLACHLGLCLDRPTIGCAKSLLLGTHEPVATAAGSWQPLFDGQALIGAVVRTRTDVRPVYVSPGHRIDVQGAVEYVLASCRSHRLPEPCRQAHAWASRPASAGRCR